MHAVTRQSQRLMCVLWLALAWSGCGGQKEPERVVVSGRVTLKGEPIQKGMIQFRPTGATSAPPAGSEIINGAYEITGRGGVVVGEYRIEIMAFKTRRVGPTADDPQEYDVEDQFLPEKYHRKSTLTMTVPSGEKQITHDIELK